MATTVNELPARIHDARIQQGSPWPGVQIRYVDEDEVAEVLTVTGQVRTDTIDQGGLLLAECDVSDADADGYYTVSLTGEATTEFPERQVYIDIDVTRPGETEPTVVMKITAVVEGEINRPEGP